jgi:protease-4
MRRVIVGFFAVVGFLTVLLVVGAVLLATGMKPTVTPLADNIILTVDLTQGLAEGPRQDRLLRLLVGGEPTLRDVLDGIETASGDPRVKVLLARVGDDELGLGKIQELRDAIATFRAKGKFALAFADSFGEFGPGTRPYYLATAFDEIWLQPMGNVGLTGLYAEVPFFKGTLDLLGIAPEFEHREEFKTAMNSLTETKMTPPHREEVDALLASIAGQIIHGISEGRKLPEPEVRDAIDRGPLLADEARQAKLVDHLGYRDEVIAHARSRAGSAAQLTGFTTYLDGAGRPHREGSTIALIYGSGLIQRAASSANPLTESNVMAANEMTRAFRAAVRDPAVRAIIFRIDSPGGSVVASESIWREVVFARERGKPVVVSMGDVAGSGGYYVAAAADKIVAEPATLTGSIGVLAGKLVVSDLFRKLGMSTDSAQIGANAAMYSSTSDFSARAHSRLEAFLDETYKGFKDHVASGRHMTQEEVEEVAKGRVWSGEDAKARGLVDELGGNAVALRLAKEAARLAPDAAVKLTVFPREKEAFEIIFNRLFGKERDGEDGGGASSGSIERSLRAAQPLLQRLETLLDNSGVLTMPAIGPVR